MSPPAGPTRCYWSLLSGDLQFIYLDPVLQYHLADQAEALAGKSLLDFVHPDEQSSAKHDLGTVLESRTLHGSVTRVRFARLSKIRRDLGYTGPASDFPAADKIAVDANYMAVDVVINWAAEGLVLCFIHAIVDIDPAADNDQTSKTSWSNWCGTPVLNSEQVQMLFKRLLMCAPQTAPTARVFQILNNNTAKDLVISWPPADQPSTREFARLANDINVNVVNTDAKTSCTRRFKSAQLVQDVGHVESVFIPHGSVIFACHKVDSPPNSTMPSSYDHHHTPYALPGATNAPYYPNPNPSAYSYQPPPPPWDRYYPPYEAGRNHEGGGAGQYTYLPPPPSPPEDSVPPPRRRVSPPPPGQSQRGHGNRPVGVLKCSSCKATSSPEWRKGPSGRKELCNACGLRYARSRAKKEGSVPSSSQHHKSSGNGRKEKSSLSLNVVKREREQNSATPPRSAGSSVASSYDYGGAPGYDYYRSYRNGGGSGGSSPDGGGGGGGGGGGSNGSFPNYDDAPPPAGGRYYAHTSPLAAPPTTNGGVSYERRYEKWDRDDGRR